MGGGVGCTGLWRRWGEGASGADVPATPEGGTVPHPPLQRGEELETQPKTQVDLRFSAHVRAFSILGHVQWPQGGFL